MTQNKTLYNTTQREERVYNNYSDSLRDETYREAKRGGGGGVKDSRELPVDVKEKRSNTVEICFAKYINDRLYEHRRN